LLLKKYSKNSSIPPSSQAPWDKASKFEDEEKDNEPSDASEAIAEAMHAGKQAIAALM
jgi:hypothetical protein